MVGERWYSRWVEKLKMLIWKLAGGHTVGEGEEKETGRRRGEKWQSREKDGEVEGLAQRCARDRWKNIVAPICHLITDRRGHPCSVQHFNMHPIKQERSRTHGVLWKLTLMKRNQSAHFLHRSITLSVLPTKVVLLFVLSFFYVLLFLLVFFFGFAHSYSFTLDFLCLAIIDLMCFFTSTAELWEKS